MTIYEIRVITNNMGINPQKMNKTNLTSSIQLQVGNTPCLKTAGTYCDQADCLWKSDCLR